MQIQLVLLVDQVAEEDVIQLVVLEILHQRVQYKDMLVVMDHQPKVEVVVARVALVQTHQVEVRVVMEEMVHQTQSQDLP